jgi:hypothetical protein
MQGFTSFFEAELRGHEMKRVEGLYIDVVREAKTLLRDGRLSGRFWLRIRMSEIRFADGSVWKENVSLAYRQKRLHTLLPHTAMGFNRLADLSSDLHLFRSAFI